MKTKSPGVERNDLLYRKHRVIGILAAVFAAGCLGVTGCGSKDSGAAKDGSKVTEAMAECVVEDQNITYEVYLAVKSDKDGTILSVEDAGTQIPEGKDGLYKKAQSLFEELKGKNKDTIKAVDAVSGATASSRAILSAAEQALLDAEK